MIASERTWNGKVRTAFSPRTEEKSLVTEQKSTPSTRRENLFVTWERLLTRQMELVLSSLES